MSRFIISKISNFLQRLEYVLPQIFRPSDYPPFGYAIAVVPSQGMSAAPTVSPFSLKDLMGDGFLWAVPKHRRTIEKRLKRKFGNPDFNWKPLRIKMHLRTCNQCGHDYEAGVLCPHCYAKVKAETQQMQDRIQEQLGLDPIEQEVIVLYEGEKSRQQPEVLNGKRIVEMPKLRPMWFSKNLLQKTTQEPAETKEVKPSDLG